MGSPMILTDQSIVCRTCLKVLDHSCTGFTYLDDETSYVKDVGSIREMLQFCIPELDLYVSTRPVVCYGCLPILVQVYNFKIKCLSGENIIKDYISRNNLQEYNHVNLNCVLIEDLKMKSQKLLSSQIENKIKLLMQELPNKNESQSETAGVLSTGPIQQGPMVIITPLSVNINEPCDEVSKSGDVDRTVMSSGFEEAPLDSSEAGAIVEHVSLRKPAKTEIAEVDESMDGDSQEADTFDRLEDFDEDSTESDDSNPDEPTTKPQDTKAEESHVNIVAVRKDLFDSSQPVPQLIVKEIPKEPTSLILNKGMVAQNGRIVIKIDRKKLQSMSPYTLTEAQEIQTKDDSNALIRTINAIEDSVSSSDESPSMPKIVSVSTVDTEGSETPEPPEGEQEYKCNKCDYETKDVIQMYDHNRRFHSFDYTCQHCPFSTSKVELLGKSSDTNHDCLMIQEKCKEKRVEPSYSFDQPSNEETIDLFEESTTESDHDNPMPYVQTAIELPEEIIYDTDDIKLESSPQEITTTSPLWLFVSEVKKIPVCTACFKFDAHHGESETVNVDQVSNRQFRRRFTLCIYCNETVENFARHIFRDHKMKKDVQAISKYPPGSRERYVWLAKMRKHGNVRLDKQENTSTPLTKTNEDTTTQTCLATPPDVPVKDVIQKTLCPFCAIPFNTDVFMKHVEVCSKAPPDAHHRLSSCTYCLRLFDKGVIEAHLKICATIKRDHKKPEKLVTNETYTRPYNRVDWTEKEKAIVLGYFENHMKTRVTPEKKECVKFVKEFGHLLHYKDWIKVKSLVYTAYRAKRLK